MQNILVHVNLFSGLLSLVVGVVALLNVTRNPVFVVIGVVTMAVTTILLWIAKGTWQLLNT